MRAIDPDAGCAANAGFRVPARPAAALMRPRDGAPA